MVVSIAKDEFYKLPVGAKELPSFATAVFEFSSDGMMVLDSVGKIVSSNTALSNMIGEGKDALLGRQPKFLFAGNQDEPSFRTFIRDLVRNGYWSGSVFARAVSGAVVPMDLRFSAIYDQIGAAHHYVGICSSAYSYMNAAGEGAFNPSVDPLAKIANANTFLNRLEHTIHKVEKDMSVLSLAYIDIDGFKKIVAEHGYLAGDILLRNTGELLRDAVDDSDLAARLKADIFACVILGAYTQEKIDAAAQSLFLKITAPYSLHRNVARVSASIGVATFPISGDNATDLVTAAAAAAKKAKSRGGAQVCYHRRLTDEE